MATQAKQPATDAKKIKVTLVRSVIGRPEKHKKIVLALGLTRTHRSVVLPDTITVRGMVNKISHLLQVESA